MTEENLSSYAYEPDAIPFKSVNAQISMTTLEDRRRRCVGVLQTRLTDVDSVVVQL